MAIINDKKFYVGQTFRSAFFAQGFKPQG